MTTTGLDEFALELPGGFCRKDERVVPGVLLRRGEPRAGQGELGHHSGTGGDGCVDDAGAASDPRFQDDAELIADHG